MARRSFTLGFKTSTTRLVREPGDSVPQAAQSLGVDPRSIRAWVAKGNCWSTTRATPTIESVRQSLFESIEVVYNRRRRHSTLGYRSPAEFEARLK